VKGGEGITKDDVLDLVTDMTLSKGFDDAIFGGLPSVEVPDTIAKKFKTERQADKLDLNLGSITNDVFLQREKKRKDVENRYLREGAAGRREKIKSVLEGLKNPILPKKRDRATKLSELSDLSNLILNEDMGQEGLELGDILSDDDLLKRAKEGFTKAGIAFSKDMDLDGAIEMLVKRAEKMGLDPSEKLKEDALLDSVDANRAKLRVLSELAKKESEEINDEVKGKAQSALKGETQADRKRLEKDPSLKILSELKRVNLTDDEKKDKAESRKFSKKRKEFRDKIVSMMSGSSHLGSGVTGEKDREIKGLDQALNMLNEIPDEFLGDVSEGYESASEKLTKIFTDQSMTTAERLSKLSEEVDEIWSEDISELSGSELGKAIAAAAISKAFVDDPEYGVRPSSDFMVTSTDSSGRSMTTPDQGMIESNTAEQASRYKDTTKERRAEAHEKLQYKLARTPKNSAEAHRIQSTLDGVVVAMLLNNDPNIPSNRSPVDPFFVAHAKATPSQEIYKAINTASKLNHGATPEQVREVQMEYLNSLSTNDFYEATGGSQGVFSDFEDILQDNYCPDHPLNGELAGKKLLAGETCPYPVAPAIKKIVRDHMTRTLLDHYTVVPTAEDTRGGFGSSKSPKKKDSNLSQFLKRNKDKYLDLLTHKNPEQREEALAYLLLQMRAANLEDLEFTGFKGKDMKTRNQAEQEKVKRDAILKLIREADRESLREVLQKVDEITHSTSVPSSKSMGSYDWDF